MVERVRNYTRTDRGRVLHVSGYTRPERPKGRKKKLYKQPIKYSPRNAVRDQYGHIMGYKL